MTSLPVGAVTFLMTDIERSTELWEHEAAAMAEALILHDELCGRIVGEFNGQMIKARGEGDSLFCVFQLASDAVGAAWSLKTALANQSWATSSPLRVRIVLHSGEADCRSGDYYGPTVNRCARLRSAASGGQVLLSDATHLLARGNMPKGTTLRDLGQHRLKDLLQPEHVFELADANRLEEFPPLRTLSELPHNLPLQLTSFIGRERELREIIALLAVNRLVTVAGPGGGGKTRIALTVAAEVLDEYTDGVWFVELAALKSPELVAQSISEVLTGPLGSGIATETQLVEALARRKLLIVIDNCEHLIEECARLAKLILGAAPEVKILATSRHVLSLGGEQVYRLAEMQLPSADKSTAAQAIQSEAVSLFVERAVARSQNFYLTDKNASAVVEVCRQLDGMPLAIELAASKLRVLTPEALVQRLGDRFGLLASPDRTEVGRQRTLRRAIEWSYDLLSADERELFLRLSVFQGSWNLEAAEFVCSGDVLHERCILDLLEQLVDKSLVTLDETSDESRYRMLQTLREFVTDLLPEDTSAATRTQLLRWLTQLVQKAEPLLTGPEQDVWLERLERELDNLRSALDWGLSQTGEVLQSSLTLTVSLSRFFLVRNLFKEGRMWLERAVAASDLSSVELKARLRNSAGILAMRDGDRERAKDLVQEAVDLFDQANDRKGLASALNNLGTLWRDLGDKQQAETYFDRSYSLFQQEGLDSAAIALSNLALAVRDRGDLDRARALFEDSLAMHQESGDLWSVALCKGSLGELAMMRGDQATAKEHLSDALALSHDLKDSRNVGLTLSTLGALAVDAGDNERAAHLFAAGKKVLGDSGASVAAADTAIFQDQERHLLTNAWNAEVEKAWAEGSTMKLDRAVRYALSG
jgi:predicted ATPase/class 3 adenylate cyclase